MAQQPPTKESRDANLDALQKAVLEWADKEIKRLDSETKFIRAVQLGRGSKDAVTTNLEAASVLTQSEVDAFLVQ